MKTRLPAIGSAAVALALAAAGTTAASDKGPLVGGSVAAGACGPAHAVTAAGPATVVFRLHLSQVVPVTVQVADSAGTVVATGSGSGDFAVPAAGAYAVRVCSAAAVVYSATLVAARSARVAGVSVARGGGTVRTAHGLATLGLLATSRGIARVRYDDAARGFHLRLRNAHPVWDGNRLTISGIGATVTVVDRAGARDTVSVTARGYRATGVLVRGSIAVV